MAYGTLTIWQEDGDVITFDLEKPTTSVGRQPGNDLVLNTTAVSRYHAQFDAAEGQVFVVDLGTVNGTFLNDQKLPPNGRTALNDDDIVLLGDVRIIFHSPKRKPGLPAANISTEAPFIEDAKVPFRMALDLPQQTVSPGARMQLAMVIHNTSDKDQVYVVDTRGMETGWARSNRREVLLAGDAQSEVMITIRPPRSTSTRPGMYPLKVRVYLKTDPAKVLETTREIEVSGYAGLAMAVEAGRKAGLFHLAVQNQGNVAAGLALEGFHKTGLFSFVFEPSQVQLDPGETAQITLAVTPLQALPADHEPIEFAMLARSLDSSTYQAPLVALYTSKPTPSSTRRRNSTGLLMAGFTIPLLFLLGIALLVGIGTLAYLHVIPIELPFIGVPASTPTLPSSTTLPDAGGSPSAAVPTPVISITAFSIAPRQATFGKQTGIQFLWSVSNPSAAQAYSLYEASSGQLLATISPEQISTGQLTLPTHQIITAFGWGQRTYTLTVTGSDGLERSSSAALEINPLNCVLAAGTPILDQPGGQPPSAAITAPADGRVAPGGKLQDGSFVVIWDIVSTRLLGWVPSQSLNCQPAGVLASLITLDPAALSSPTP
jgi:pSer/pThr/pTyr-binding forkhead associated (FHA) protein